jgi:hypothetical protein
MTVQVSLPSTVSPLGSAVTATLPAVTNSPITADYIDPKTGDYASMVKGLDAIDAQVILAMNTVKGSGAAVMEEGCNLEDIQHILDTVRREIQSEVKVAFKRLIDNHDIRLGAFSFDVQPENQYVATEVEYQNLRSSGVRMVGLVITNY